MPDPRIWPIVNVNDTFFPVTNVSAIVLAANPNRADTDFTNDSDYWIYLARGNTAIFGSGIPLAPYGGSYHIGTNNQFLGDVHGVAACPIKVTANLSISEGSRP